MAEVISTYKGRCIEIVYDRRFCIHAAECGRGSRVLFDVNKDPWCDADAVPVDEAADIVSRCPTGALRFTRRDGGAAERPPGRNVVTVAPDGPLYVRGRLELDGDVKVPAPAVTRMALCRCGRSANKPYCDGSHSRVDFHDAGPVSASCRDGDPGEGILKITAVKDGPLLLAGPVVIRAASGRDAFCGTQVALCRCGASANRPFCDGSHTAVHFVSD